MNCEEFRRVVGAEPNTPDSAVLEHSASCAECARYRAELRAMDGLIHKALTIAVDVPATRATATRAPSMNWRLAASVLLGLVVFSLAWLAYPRQTLAKDLVEHVMHEASALEPTSQIVDATTVTQVLARSGVRLERHDLPVSFAMVCPIRGREAPHLVVQTAAGPITVLVLAHEKEIRKPRQFEEQGFVGTLMPAPRGVIAVLAEEGSVDAISQTVLSALHYDAQ